MEPVMVYDEARGWQPLGRVLGIDFGTEPHETAVVDWARRYGKSAALLTTALEVPLTNWVRELVDDLFAEQRARRDRRIRRLARDLRLWPEAARSQFDAVERVLEEAGIGDGYGRLTIPQPVRPPIEPPTSNFTDAPTHGRQ